MPMEDLTCPPGTTPASERDFRWNQGVSKTRIVVFTLQGGKTSLWEGGVRVPSILYWKGVLQPSSSEQMIAVQAALPTLLSLSGEGPVSDETDGRSVWSALTGGALSPNPLEEYLDNFPRGENVAVP